MVLVMLMAFNNNALKFIFNYQMFKNIKKLSLLLIILSNLNAIEKPNIIFIMADDLGVGDLSSYGAKDMSTPNIDKLMKDGCRLDNAYANCPVCSPTRAAFLTGRYPDMVGVPGVIRTHKVNNWGYLSPGAKTLPSLLKEAGYYSALIGKWHLGLLEPNTPNGRGFDYFKGFLGDMMDDYYNYKRHGVNYMRENKEVINPKGHATDLFSEWSVDFIKNRSQKEDPFFLFLSYNAPHTPIQPPKDWLDKVTEREKDISPQRAKLVSLIEHMDYGIGRVMQAAAELDNTIIVFTSDNGGQANVGARNSPWKGEKQQMWEGGLRVPACIVWKGVIQSGTTYSKDSMTMDWMPTIAEIVGLKKPTNIDGVSMLSGILGKNNNTVGDRTLIWVRREGGSRYKGQAYYAVRKGPWKILQNTSTEPFELYNIKNDPTEMNSVTNNVKKLRELENVLREHVRNTGFVRWQGRSPDVEKVDYKQK